MLCFIKEFLLIRVIYLYAAGLHTRKSNSLVLVSRDALVVLVCLCSRHISKLKAVSCECHDSRICRRCCGKDSRIYINTAA